MANRDNHYEAAFEAYLRGRGMPYVAVDEARRSVLADGRSLKSLDFIVASSAGRIWLIDVKGRRFPSGDHQKQYWKNWSAREDLQSLAQWEAVFGRGFEGLFVFAYNIVGDRAPLPPERLFEHRGWLYAFLGIELTEYAARAHPISPSWDTVAMPVEEFRRVARPIEEFLGERGVEGDVGQAVATEVGPLAANDF